MAPLKRPPARKAPKDPELWQEVGGDLAATALFILISASFGELSVLLAEAAGIPNAAAGLAVLLTGLVLFDPIRVRIGGPGASFNPSNNIAMAAVGKGTFIAHALRMVAQAIGGALGAFVALNIYPESWVSNFAKMGLGVRPNITLSQGIACELGLGFAMNFIILAAGHIESFSKVLAMILPLVATAVLIFVGEGYTGPSMNPAFTFSWFWHTAGHDAQEHAVVFWAAPLIGGALAGLSWSWLTAPKPAPVAKPKMAAAKKSPTSGQMQAKAPPAKAKAGGKKSN